MRTTYLLLHGQSVCGWCCNIFVYEIVGYTQDLWFLCQRVQAWNGGAKPVLAGTARALRYILPDDGNYRYDLESDYFKVGYVRTASGFDTLCWNSSLIGQLRSPFCWMIQTFMFFLLVLINFLKVCIEGQLSPILRLRWNSDLSQTATFIKNWKTIVATNALVASLRFLSLILLKGVDISTPNHII